MFRNLLKPDSGLMIFMTQVTDVLFLSMFFMLGCIPVITMGASFAALYDTVYRGFRRGEKETWRRFLHSYRVNWKVSILPTILFLIFVIALGFAMIQQWNATVLGGSSWAMFAAVAVVMVVLVGVLSLLFPMLSRFDSDFTSLIRNTALLAMSNLPRTILLGILNLLVAFACIRYIIPLFFLPAIGSLLSTFLIEPMFRPYLPPSETMEAAD